MYMQFWYIPRNLWAIFEVHDVLICWAKTAQPYIQLFFDIIGMVSPSLKRFSKLKRVFVFFFHAYHVAKIWNFCEQWINILTIFQIPWQKYKIRIMRIWKCFLLFFSSLMKYAGYSIWNIATYSYTRKMEQEVKISTLKIPKPFFDSSQEQWGIELN